MAKQAVQKVMTGKKSLPHSDEQRRRDKGKLRFQGAQCNQEINVGRCIRMIRESRSLSIRALAEHSGLAVNTLSLIENGKTSPSVSTLQQLAAALQVPITAFFETDSDAKQIVYTKAGKAPCATFTHGKIEDLGAGLADKAIETFLVSLEPGAVSSRQPIVHSGHEFVFCLNGRIEYTIEDQTYLLDTGDSLSFEAHLPHWWQNVGTHPARVMLVLCPSDARDRASELHFFPPEKMQDWE
jgi:transcriptional regulator with XRE-family HTH domain